MDQCPSCIPHLVSKLDSFGYDDARLSQKEAVAQSFQTQVLKLRRKSKDKAKEEDGDGDDSKDAVPSKYWRIDSLSKQLLRDGVAPAIDPQVLSVANLKVLDKLGTDKAKIILLDIIEGCSGLPRDLPITGQLRQWRHLLEEVAECSRLGGRRALCLTLPPDLTSFLYKLSGCDEARKVVNAEHNFTHEKVDVPYDKVPSFKTFQDLHVIDNHSEQKAAIASKFSEQGSPAGRPYMLTNEFPNQNVKSPPPIIFKYVGPTPSAAAVPSGAAESSDCGGPRKSGLASPVRTPIAGSKSDIKGEPSPATIKQEGDAGDMGGPGGETILSREAASPVEPQSKNEGEDHMAAADYAAELTAKIEQDGTDGDEGTSEDEKVEGVVRAVVDYYDDSGLVPPPPSF